MPTASCSSLTRRRLQLMTGIAACSVLLTACSGAADPAAAPSAASTGGTATVASSMTSTRPDPDEVGTATQDPGATKPVTAGTVTVEVGSASGAKEFHYDKVTLQAPAGSKIKLKFVNHTDSKY